MPQSNQDYAADLHIYAAHAHTAAAAAHHRGDDEAAGGLRARAQEYSTETAFREAWRSIRAVPGGIRQLVPTRLWPFPESLEGTAQSKGESGRIQDLAATGMDWLLTAMREPVCARI